MLPLIKGMCSRPRLDIAGKRLIVASFQKPTDHMRIIATFIRNEMPALLLVPYLSGSALSANVAPVHKVTIFRLVKVTCAP